MGHPIVVKFLWKGSYVRREEIFRRQLPADGCWGRCRFVFDPGATQYDWLAVYDDLPVLPGEKNSRYIESLPCAPQHSLLVTVEPSSIKTYGHDFLSQFGVIVTSQEPWAITNRQAVRTQPALRWFYGDSEEDLRTYARMWDFRGTHKPSLISTVCSNKRQTHTLHAARYRFTWQMKQLIPELEIFGHGVRPLVDKAQALDEFRYHIAVENHVCEHHWTEKLADAFLGLTLPFYFGCPNLADYFPHESFIAIDIRNPAAAARIIRDAIDTNQYQRRLPAIKEARRLVLDEYNQFAMLAREIESRFDATAPPVPGTSVLSRHQSRNHNLGHLLRFGWEHLRVRSRSRRQRRAQAA